MNKFIFFFSLILLAYQAEGMNALKNDLDQVRKEQEDIKKQIGVCLHTIACAKFYMDDPFARRMLPQLIIRCELEKSLEEYRLKILNKKLDDLDMKLLQNKQKN